MFPLAYVRCVGVSVLVAFNTDIALIWGIGGVVSLDVEVSYTLTTPVHHWRCTV